MPFTPEGLVRFRKSWRHSGCYNFHLKLIESLESLTFDTTNFEYLGIHEGVKVWKTPDHDMLELHFFDKKPDILASLDDLAGLRIFYRALTSQSGLGIIEVDRIPIDELPAIRTIFKTPQQPSGMSYLASITIPFRDFSLFLKGRCKENETITGRRDAIIGQKLMAEGKVTIEIINGRPEMHGWAQDPYDSSFKPQVRMNLSEAEEYDKDFPDHPLSRARRLLHHLQRTTKIDSELKQLPGFKFGSKRPWWKFW